MTAVEMPWAERTNGFVSEAAERDARWQTHPQIASAGRPPPTRDPREYARGGPFVPSSRTRRGRSRDDAPTPIAWPGVETAHEFALPAKHTPASVRHAADLASSCKCVARERLAELEDARAHLTMAEYHSQRQAIVQSI